jgi:hypothetical protein
MIEPYPVKIEMLMQLHYSSLSEKDRRRYAALESLKLDRGGVAYISAVLGIDRGTILQGRKELTSDPGITPVEKERQRKTGGGRKKNGETT